jgi:hypothetical protein
MGATDVASYNNTLAASTVDTVTISRDAGSVRVYFDSGSTPIFFTVDGSAPTVNGANCYRVPASAGASTSVDVTGVAPTVVKLISSGTPTYSVEATL